MPTKHYVQSFDGRNYLRFKQQTRVRLPDGPLAAVLKTREYKDAIAAAKAADKPIERKKKSLGGGLTIREVVTEHMASVYWRENISHGTRVTRGYALMGWVDGRHNRAGELVRVGQGDASIYDLTPELLSRELAERQAEDGHWAANAWLGAVSVMLKERKQAFRIKRDFDPTFGVKAFGQKKQRTADDGFKTLPPELLQQYLDYWPYASPQRIAGLMLYVTGAACCDVIRLCLSDIKDGFFQGKRLKTGVDFVTEQTPELIAEIKAAGIELGPIVRRKPRRGQALGKAFSRLPIEDDPEGNAARAHADGRLFSEQFRGWLWRAGVPVGYGAHSFRKRAACDDAVERGMDPTWLKAKYGWKQSTEVDLYTEKFNRLRVMQLRSGVTVA
jgi:hypothetical protein